MWFNELSKRWLGRPTTSQPARSRVARQRSLRLTVEQLEDRLVPSNFTAASVADLIAEINAANVAGGAKTIQLAAGKTFSLNAVEYHTDCRTGLPALSGTEHLDIRVNGGTHD